MQTESVKAETSKIAYLSGEEFSISLTFVAPPKYLLDVVNVSIDLQKVERGRNQFTFGFGTNPTIVGNVLTVKQRLSSDIAQGLYYVGGVILCMKDDSNPVQHRVAFAPVFFLIQTILDRPCSKLDLIKIISFAEDERRSYTNHAFETPRSKSAVSDRKEFSVVVFGVGCLLHSPQQLEGLVITPLGLGMSHDRLHKIVNVALSKLDFEPLKFDPEMEKQFESQTPTVMVSYPTVFAADYSDALDFCRDHSSLLFEYLGLDRGQKPKEFACFATEIGTCQRWHMYLMPWYKGNLISDFNPSSTANLIEKTLPKVQGNPFLRLIVRTYSDATAEENPGFALLRYWTVLELLGDKYVEHDVEIKHPNGERILNLNGKPETTKTKSGRVYQYILSSGSFVHSGAYTEEGIQKTFMIGADESHPGFT